MIEAVATWVRRLNDLAAVVIGVALLATVVFILTEIAVRQFGGSLGGTDEISGYVMAGVTSWGMAYALTSLSHVRIDLARLRLQPIGPGDARHPRHAGADGDRARHRRADVAGAVQDAAKRSARKHAAGDAACGFRR